MKKFMEEYGLLSVAAIVIVLLIGLSSPVGGKVKDSVVGLVNRFSNATNSLIGEDIVPVPLENGTTIRINDERTVRIMASYGGSKYLVIERDSIGNEPYRTAGAGCQAGDKDSCDNTYENSELDTYLNTTWYGNLSSAMKDAIVDAEIYQEFYTHKDDSSTCYDKNSSSRVGDYGRHPLSTDWDDSGRSQTWSGATSNTITRKVFLPSIKEISTMGVDLDNYVSTRSFLTESSGSMVNLWTRDGDATDREFEVVLGYNHGSPNRFSILARIGARPAYVIDLSLVNYEKVS